MSDKTGTLTKNQMIFRGVSIGNGLKSYPSAKELTNPADTSIRHSYYGAGSLALSADKTETGADEKSL